MSRVSYPSILLTGFVFVALSQLCRSSWLLRGFQGWSWLADDVDVYAKPHTQFCCDSNHVPTDMARKSSIVTAPVTNNVSKSRMSTNQPKGTTLFWRTLQIRWSLNHCHKIAIASSVAISHLSSPSYLSKFLCKINDNLWGHLSSQPIC